VRCLTRRLLFLFVLHASAAIGGRLPSPEEFFGHPMGADRKLVAWDKVVAYFQELDRESDRLQLEVLGQTTEGRPLIAVTMAAPHVLAGLEHYRSIQQKLADPRRTPESEAQRLFREGRVVVMITCSIHSTEVASTMTAIEYAHRLATANDDRSRVILENVILLLVPSLNPDGVEIVRRWYEKTLGTPYEGTAPPELYHKYTGHDNNRDWYMFTQQETRLVVEKLHNRWHPQVVYDVHQQGPYGSRMFVPPWMDPIDPNVDPILVQLSNMIGMGIAADLTIAGKKGVVVNALYDFWTPARHYQAYHGGTRILSEAASARLASPMEVRREQILTRAPGYDPRAPSWNYLEPWLGGVWRLRDIVDYQLISFDSCLYQAAVRREDLLRAFYRVGQRAVARQHPWAFLVPRAQRDPGSARKLLETLAFGLVEIESAKTPFQAAGQHYDAGTYVIRMQQPYSSFAKTLLERQHYPDLREYPGGPPKRPYDVTAHTLPLLMGVDVRMTSEPLAASLEPAQKFEFTLMPAPERGARPSSDVDSWRWVTARWRAGQAVYRDTQTGDFFPEPVRGRSMRRLAEPRIGLYRSWVPAIDEGWTRWVLEQFGFRYHRLVNPEIQAGRLRDRWDVIVFPDQSPSTLDRGYRLGEMPEGYTGGLGEKGVAALREFVEQGGRLVFLNRSARWATAHFELGLSDITQDVASEEFYCPGSLLWVEGGAHPLLYGLPGRFAIWHEHSPAWQVLPESGARTVLRYPARGLLASGWLLGERRIAQASALVVVPYGRGQLILFGFRPQYRGQSYQTFKIFFNALLPF